ncbi:MAG: divergent polysaccharide deacetylase family protein [Halofilum sp. (in: g-proteobacteria)]
MRRAAAALALSLAAAGPAPAATVALIVDDLGHSAEHARRALALPPPITVAVLPQSAHAERIARASTRADADVLVHLPMEAEGHRPGPGVLRVEMDRDRFRARVQRALAAVPGAMGVNNHMGSRLTGATEPMTWLMHELAGAARPLAFIDSRTSPRSRAGEAARAAGLASAERDVFLDHDHRPHAIEYQVERWLAHARRDGCALAIAHPRPETFAVLERVLPRTQGVDRVGLSTYIKRCGSPADPERSWQHASWSHSPTAVRNSKPSP